MTKRALVPVGIAEPSERVEVYAELPNSFEEIGFFVPRYMGPIADLEATRRMPQLEIVQLLTAGYDHALSRIPPGVSLHNAGPLHTTSTAELALALTLAKLRRIDDFARSDGTWLSGRYDSLADKRVVVIGAGEIGTRICELVEAFQGIAISVARTARGNVHGVDALNELLPTADVVIVVVPLNDTTRGMVNDDFLRAMKDGALLVNVARGPVADTEAITRHADRLRFALDVTDPEPLPADHPLWQQRSVLISPHVGGNTSAFIPRARRLVHDQLQRWFDGRPLMYGVDETT